MLLREVLVQSSFPHEWPEVMQLLTTSQKIYFVANNKNLGNYESSVGPLPVVLRELCEGFFSPELKAIEESWYGICLHQRHALFLSTKPTSSTGKGNDTILVQKNGSGFER